jgi:hypothetical protein
VDEELNQHHRLIRWDKRLTGNMCGENAAGMSRLEQSTNFVPYTADWRNQAAGRGSGLHHSGRSFLISSV